MTFEEWVIREGGHLNDSDPEAKSARRIALRAWQAATAAERERCVDIIERYRVPAGNSSAGVIAAERTIGALKAIRDEIRKVES